MNPSSPTPTEQILSHISFQPLLSMCSYTIVITCRYNSNSDFSLDIRSYFTQFHNFHIHHLNCYIMVYLKTIQFVQPSCCTFTLDLSQKAKQQSCCIFRFLIFKSEHFLSYNFFLLLK